MRSTLMCLLSFVSCRSHEPQISDRGEPAIVFKGEVSEEQSYRFRSTLMCVYFLLCPAGAVRSQFLNILRRNLKDIVQRRPRRRSASPWRWSGYRRRECRVPGVLYRVRLSPRFLGKRWLQHKSYQYRRDPTEILKRPTRTSRSTLSME